IGLVQVPGRLGDARAGTFRLLCLLFGYTLTVLCALSLLHVSVTHLLLGGVLTGVILGIAAQQVLANVFAGVMLLFARPFAVGDELQIRSGALGGPIVGRVTGMTLTYVRVLTKVGPVLVPNAAVLAAAVGPATDWTAV
ncbi:mechanosensitive ion channel domain-containing protein, partial [Actinospica sp.]|uniref:mechanosensitive ion channel domain-containing protein n=1 Tax=Actinospica sp. TaxID=1872142 RepID=UPI002C409579